ncbi:hypothetical protein [Neomoorella mulderi]|uniref:Bacterial Ig-like domain (Group 1) n=1 Tax=Moorella mulderi DSM 14980 TaxID=1122241 RepID=A0A151AVM7_9FIRM|nr:hypothetical protein [Moorella mulderi]KYH31457.1 bacterial Ig-like domain (group 1) [Moorella mulderi DSM 14980]
MFKANRSRHRVAAGLLAVVLTFSLAFSGVPLAIAAGSTPSLDVTLASSNAGEKTTYNFTADGLSLATSDLAGKDVEIDFPSGFAVSDSPAVEVDVTTVSGAVYYAYVAPSVSSTSSNIATLTIPASIGLPANSTVTKVVVKALTVTNTNIAGSYNASLIFKGPSQNVTLTKSITINPVVGSIELSSPTASPTGTAGSQVSVLVKGLVKDIAGNPYANIPVTFSINPNVSGFTSSPTSVSTMADGTFAATVQFTPDGAGTYTVTVAAGAKTTSFNVSVNAAAAAKLAWVTPPSSINYNGRTALTVQLLDHYNNPVNAPNGGTVVDLAAFTSDVTSGGMAGRFYDAVTGGSEITRVTIPAGSNSVTIYLQPLNPSTNITVEARSTGLATASADISVGAAPQSPTAISLGGATGGVAGYVYEVTVQLDHPADRDYSLTVNLLDDGNSAAWASWDTTKKSDYLASGSKANGETLTFPAGQQEMSIYIYTTAAAAGKTLTVNVSGSDLTTNGSITISYIAADMTRSLTTGWNVLSTPLALAGDGNLQSLGLNNNNFEIAWTYVNGQWSQVTTQALNPLQGYFVKAKTPVTLNYTFKRVADVREAVPPTRDLSAGWNLVGMGTDNDSATVSDVLASVKGKYAVVVNPGLGNRAWLNGSAETSDQTSSNKIGKGDAYWVYMTAPGTLAGLMAPEMVQ